MSIAKTLKIESIIAIRDTREQNPVDLGPLRVETGTLTTGDYSVKGLEHIIAVERKSIEDLIGCVSQSRERFEKEVQRLKAYPIKALVIEGSWSTIELKQYRGQTHPNAVFGSVMSWLVSGLPVIMAEDRQRAGRMIARILYLGAKQRYGEVYSFLENQLKVAQ